jgi:threonine dehydrogenase-like Zn-dependent dehydrogenase
MLTRWAAALGCTEIAVADVSEQRLAHARNGGATQLLQGSLDALLPRIAELGDGAGAQLVVDCTGNPAVFQPALAAAARFGKVILLGDTGFPGRQCLSSDLMTKGLTLQATHDSHDRDGWTERRVDELFFSHLLNNRFPLEGLITHEFSPIDCAQAYDLAERERQHTMGILFDWTNLEHDHATDR